MSHAHCLIFMLGAAIKDVCTLGEGGISNIADKSGEGGDLAVSEHHFQCGLWKREEGKRKGREKIISSSSSCV